MIHITEISSRCGRKWIYGTVDPVRKQTVSNRYMSDGFAETIEQMFRGGGENAFFNGFIRDDLGWIGEFKYNKLPCLPCKPEKQHFMNTTQKEVARFRLLKADRRRAEMKVIQCAASEEGISLSDYEAYWIWRDWSEYRCATWLLHDTNPKSAREEAISAIDLFFAKYFDDAR